MAMVYHRKLVERAIFKRLIDSGRYWVASSALVVYTKCNVNKRMGDWDVDVHQEDTQNGNVACIKIPNVYLTPPN
jgi:hypothetical protein